MRAMSKADVSLQYFEFYVQSYLDSLPISVLSMAAESCYVRLITRQWIAERDGEVLPVDPMHLRLLTKASPAEWKELWPEIEALFPITEDGRGRSNPQQRSRLIETLEFRETKKNNGKQGGRPPKHAKKNQEDNAGSPTRDDGQETDNQNKTGRSAKRVKQEADGNQKETSGFDSVSTNMRTENQNTTSGFESVPKNGQIENQDESLKFRFVTPLSPPPSGGGASPAAPPLRVLPGGKGNSNSTPGGDPFAGPPLVDLHALLSTVPSDHHGVISELLQQHSRPAKWASWIEELHGLVSPRDAGAGELSVRWADVGQGLRELLLVNPDKQRITMGNVEAFVRAVPRRRLRASIPGTPLVTSNAHEADPGLAFCIRQARAGDPEHIAYCLAEGIDYTAQESA